MDFSLYIGATGSHSSTQKPESDSRHLYAGHHPPSKQVPDGFIPGLVQDPGFDVFPVLSTLHLWFTFVRLSDSHMTHYIAPFTMTLTTKALYQRSSWLFKAYPCRPALEGPPPSLVQLMHNLALKIRTPCAPVAHSTIHNHIKPQGVNYRKKKFCGRSKMLRPTDIDDRLKANETLISDTSAGSAIYLQSCDFWAGVSKSG